MMPQRFSVRLPILIVKGPKQSIPVDQKGGLYSLSREGGKSAIFGIIGLALHFLASLTIVLVFLDGFSATQDPLLASDLT